MLKGALAVWGHAAHGRLGQQAGAIVPTVCQHLISESMASVACGGAHTCAVTGAQVCKSAGRLPGTGRLRECVLRRRRHPVHVRAQRAWPAGPLAGQRVSHGAHACWTALAHAASGRC